MTRLDLRDAIVFSGVALMALGAVLWGGWGAGFLAVGAAFYFYGAFRLG